MSSLKGITASGPTTWAHSKVTASDPTTWAHSKVTASGPSTWAYSKVTASGPSTRAHSKVTSSGPTTWNISGTCNWIIVMPGLQYEWILLMNLFLKIFLLAFFIIQQWYSIRVWELGLADSISGPSSRWMSVGWWSLSWLTQGRASLLCSSPGNDLTRWLRTFCR